MKRGYPVVNKIRFAIWGCGLIANTHALSIKSIEGAELKGTFDLNESAASEFAAKHGATVFHSVTDLLNSEEIDAVCICLPSGLHYEAAMQCLAHGKHVVIEKPMALTTKQAGCIVKAARKHSVKLTVISQLRYSEAIKKVKRIVDSGKLGRITVANVIMKYWRDEDYYKKSSWRGTWRMDGGGALMNQGIHGMDLLQYIMGGVSSVSAYSKTLAHDIETEDTLVAALEFECGAIGAIQATTSVYPGYGRRIEICGSRGTVVLCEDSIEICDVEGEEPPDKTGDANAMASTPVIANYSLHKKQIADFVNAIKTGCEPFIGAGDGKRAIDLICAIYRSAKTKKRVYLNKNKCYNKERKSCQEK